VSPMLRLLNTRLAVGALLLAAIPLADSTVISAAGAAKVVHAFRACDVGTCRGGSAPYGNLVGDSTGNFYGTTSDGGRHGSGTVFELSPNGNGGYAYQTIYDFCSEQNCADGRTPHGTLIIGAEGDLYGTTLYGGEEEGGLGIAFRLERTADGWELINIHNFCGADAPSGKEECMGGATAAGGLTYRGAATGAPYDGMSPLYGASMEGGEGEAGIIFQMTPRKGQTREKDKEEWRVKELYVFCEPDGAAARGKRKISRTPEEDGNCDDGKTPSGNLIVDTKGNLYGTTFFGGEDANVEGGGGVVFQLSRNRLTKMWEETVLHKFCSEPNCRDGRSPSGGLLMDAAGNLFGAAQSGGKSCGAHDQCGVVFMISPNGEQSVSRVLHDFCTADGCADGAGPVGDLAVDASGNIYGATPFGGVGKGGVVYRLQPDGKLKVLQSFCADGTCAVGRYPNGVIFDGGGSLVGTTIMDGKKGGGTLFRISP
jgi:uncharacterized repeat protein (TIGR03803 family)